MESIRMKPAMKEMIWGGQRLKELFGKDIPSAHTGEAWEVASHPHGESTAFGGPYDGMSLSQLVRTYKEALVGSAVYARFGEYFPLLVKFIDASRDLSVQVHPNDEQAKELEGEDARGKTEMWYVLEASEGASLVYGLNREVTEEELIRAVREETIGHLLNRVDVSPGDTFFIPPGTLHAIGGGLMIAEIQQNSDLTYRLYDYGRLGLDGKPRELHTDKGARVTNRGPMSGRERVDIDEGIRCDFFEARRLCIRKETVLPIDPARFEILICVGGEGSLDQKPVKAGDTFLIPASAGQTLLRGEMQLLQTHVTL